MAASNGMSAPIPGQGLTKKLGSTPWQQPPKFTKLNEASDYIFNQLMNEPTLHQLFYFLKNGLSIEAIARVIIFAGFSKGFWTPDLGMLLAKPLMFMLIGIAKRADIKYKLTHVDRSPLKAMVGIKQMEMSQSNPKTGVVPEIVNARMKGIMAPENE